MGAVARRTCHGSKANRVRNDALGTYVPPEVTCVVVATVETGGPLWWPKCPKVIRCRSPASTPSEFHGAWSRPMASSSWVDDRGGRGATGHIDGPRGFVGQ